MLELIDQEIRLYTAKPSLAKIYITTRVMLPSCEHRMVRSRPISSLAGHFQPGPLLHVDWEDAAHSD